MEAWLKLLLRRQGPERLRDDDTAVVARVNHALRRTLTARLGTGIGALSSFSSSTRSTVLDNLSKHKRPRVKRWLQRHPRSHLHFTPTNASWLNQVERWFAGLTDRQLRRGSHRSRRELRRAIETYVATTKDAPKPFVWVKSADQILRSIARFAQRTLDFHRKEA